jgi:hypothetical protein
MGRFPPFTRRSLLSRDEATGTRACKLNKASCHELSAAALRIEQGARTGPARSAPVALWLVAARPIEPLKGGTMPKISLGIQ